MDREAFIGALVDDLGPLSQDPRSGCGLLVDEAERRGTPLNHLAYILATAWWETARAMQPVREAYFVADSFEKAEKWRKKNLHYYPYYGRGFVQLTWKNNYKKASDKLGQDFVTNPDLVMRPEYAVPITFDGMTEGWFTGRALDDYIDEIDDPDQKDLQEYVDARRIINGTDKANTIGKIALQFEHALKRSGYANAASDAPLTFAQPATTVAARFDTHITALGLRYFKPYEFLAKGSAHGNPNSSAFGLNTDPPESLWKNINKTALMIDELRHRLQRPITLSSVYRSPAYNGAIGGASNSEHKQFRAIDFSVVGSPVGPVQWANALRDMPSTGIFKGGIGVYTTFVHLDTRGTNVDWVG